MGHALIHSIQKDFGAVVLAERQKAREAEQKHHTGVLKKLTNDAVKREVALQEAMIALEKAESGRARAEEALVAAEEKLHNFLHTDTQKLLNNKRLRKYYLKKDKV